MKGPIQLVRWFYGCYRSRNLVMATLIWILAYVAGYFVFSKPQHFSWIGMLLCAAAGYLAVTVARRADKWDNLGRIKIKITKEQGEHDKG